MRKLHFKNAHIIRLSALAASLFTVLALPHSAIADEVPLWLRQAATAQAAIDSQTIPAIVLLKEQSIKVDASGRVTTTQRFAVRVLTNEGRGEAVASVLYNKDTASVRAMRAWVIRPSEEVKRFDKERVLDVEAAPNDVYGEVRAKLISARDDAEPGAVFGCEWTSQERSVFTQFEWHFQERLPVLVSRFSITLPAGWSAEGVVLNHSNFEPTVNGTTYTWEMRGLPHIEEEPASPPVTTIAPRLAVSFFPPPGKRSGIGRTFNNWADVSRWLTELSDAQAIVSEELAQKAKQLVANSTTELERIRAIGRYVQSVNYISIQTGLGRGGGYRPHSAAEVFAKSYGDCKDKANLMRAMLRSVGIDSYLVGIYSGDATYVREEWPSPQQFNHCIIAVRVGAETQAATIVNHSLGRLLIFDPTDSDTVVGDLPDHEQGSLALIIAGDAGALVRMPVTPPEANRVERVADVTLDANGTISAIIKEMAAGQSAAFERSRFRRLSQQDYAKLVESWITRGATGAKVTRVDSSDNMDDGRFSLVVEFNAERYAQLMQGRLLVFRPAIVSRRESLFLSETSRRHSVVLDSHAYTETVKVKLPAGFDIDEMPDPIDMKTSFGKYSTSYEVKEGHLYFNRALVLTSSRIPAANYQRVREFFEKIRAAEQAPVVLVRK